MASPLRNKTSFFPESRFGVANTSSNGRAYKCTGDGTWRPITAHQEAREDYSGAEAPLAQSIADIVRGYEGSYTKYARTVGDELWWRYMIGGFDSSPTSAPGGFFTKNYHTDRRGPRGSYTIVQDRFAFGTVYTIYQAVYSGVKVQAWSFYVTVDQPIQLGATVVGTRAEITGGAPNNPAPYAAGGSAFHWGDTRVRIGTPGVVGSFVIGFLNYIRYRQDNKLDLTRYYIDGDDNMVRPEARDTNTGVLDLEFQYAAVVDTYLRDAFEKGKQISVEVEAIRGGRKLRLWLPNLHVGNVSIQGGLEGVAVLTATCSLRFEPDNSFHAVELDYTTDGSSP